MSRLITDGRWLRRESGEPFFYLGDTAWELFHRLDREEMALYFETRSKQGFTVVQCVLLAEFEGVTTPNAYGRLPLHTTDGLPDPTRPDTEGEYSYWAHVDYAIRLAAEHGLMLALLPTWGDKFNLCWGKGPVIFTPENALIYARWLGSRYAACPNLIWMLGGDRPIEPEHRPIIDAMAKGLLETAPGHLITFHPRGWGSSLESLPGADYIDLHTVQSGHDAAPGYASEQFLLPLAEGSRKPYMDAEPRYEDHPACFNAELGYFWSAADVRQNAYRSVLAGACGHTYGNHCVWSMNREPGSYFPYRWQEALNHPGAEQMRHVKALRLSHDYFSLRPANELVVSANRGMGQECAATGNGYAYVYAPLGLPFTVELDLLKAQKAIRACWFDPRSGESRLFGILPPGGQTTLVPPTQGQGCDWVLVLENV